MGGQRYSPILLTGKDGQVGWELQRALAPLGEVVAVGRHQLDLAQPDQIRAIVRQIRPKLIVNAAAYTAVDKAEDQPDLAMAVNGVAPGILAEEAKRLDAGLVHYSTDYVFDGVKRSPYMEDDDTNPLNSYGKTKLSGEAAIEQVEARSITLRIGWVYGLRGRNFLRTMLRLAGERDELRIVDDQVGVPTWSRMVAETTALMLPAGREFTGARGTWHLASQGSTTWYGFARAIFERAGPLVSRRPRLVPIKTEEYPTPAVRPAYSVMAAGRLAAELGLELPAWERLLDLVMEEALAATAGPLGS